jgi:hypothetical protein
MLTPPGPLGMNRLATAAKSMGGTLLRFVLTCK